MSKKSRETPPPPGFLLLFAASFRFSRVPEKLADVPERKKARGERKRDPSNNNSLLFVGGSERRRGAAYFRSRRPGRRGQGLGRAGQLGEGEVGHRMWMVGGESARGRGRVRR